MTRLCVSLTEASLEALIDRMVDLAPQADLFEVRADHVQGPLDLLTLLRTRTRPVIFTCRPAGYGGRFEGGEQRRRRLLLEAAKRGFDYVDVEHDSGFGEVMLEKSGRGLLLSHHDFARTPDDLPGLYRRLCALGADVVKLACTPASLADVGRLMELAHDAAGQGGIPLVPLAMGPLGLVTRLAAGRHGAPFTYASPGPGDGAGPGQLPVTWMEADYGVRRVGPTTRLFGVVGASAAHSLSPAMHNAAFAARGVDALYVPLETPALEPLLGALPQLRLEGFSVTRPYKVALLPHLAQVEPSAARAGSVNTVSVHGRALHGWSTDGQGVLEPLRRRLDLRGRTVLIVGAGGAARAAAVALVEAGAQVKVLARRAEQAAETARLAGCTGGTLDQLPHCAWEVLINATPLGSFEALQATPVPAALLRPGTVVFDMVPVPLETRLLREARAAGCLAVDGLEMLVAQAAAQFEAWTGRDAPHDVMRAAALDCGRRRAQAVKEARP